MRTLCALAVVAMLGWVQPAHARVRSVCPNLRPQDEIWLVSTREMGIVPRAGTLCHPCFVYQRYGCQCGWQSASGCRLQSVLTPDTHIVIQVHGNRMTEDWVKRRALDFYAGLRCRADERPIRLIAWSWPASPIPRRAAIKRDVRVKFRRTPLQSYFLAWWMHNCCGNCQVGMVGYSYGATTILGALHLMGGGNLSGRCLPGATSNNCQRVRAVLWAAATQSDWLLPGRPHGCALRCINRGDIFFNRLDPATRRLARAVGPVTGPALGFIGLTNPKCGPPEYSRLCQFNATSAVGRYHSWNRYRDCPWIMNRTCHTLLSWPPCTLAERQYADVQKLTMVAPMIGVLH